MIYSYSKIEDYYKCPKYFKLKHLDKVVIDKKESADLKFGTALHLALKESLLGASALDIFKLYWLSEDKNNLEYGRCSFDDLFELGNIFLERFERLHKKHLKYTYLEVSMLKNDLKGVADFVGDYKGVPSIIDFKTSSYPYNKEIVDYNPQMYIYNYLSSTELNFVPHQLVYIIFIKNIKFPRIQVLTRDLTNKDRAVSILNNVNRSIGVINNDSVFINNTRNCIIGSNKCEYFEVCHGKPGD